MKDTSSLNGHNRNVLLGVSPRHSLNAGFAEAVQKHGEFKTTRKNTSNTIEGHFSGVKAELRSKRGMLVSVAYAFGRRQPEASDRSRPILLKKSALVATAKKLASEIEILKVGRGLRAQISRSDERKRRFHRSRLGLFGQSDFFNRIGQKRTWPL